MMTPHTDISLSNTAILLIGGGGSAIPLAAELIRAGQTVRLLEQDESDAARCRDLLSRIGADTSTHIVKLEAPKDIGIGCIIEPAYGGEAHRDWWLAATDSLTTPYRLYDASVSPSQPGLNKTASAGLFWFEGGVELVSPMHSRSDAEALADQLRSVLGRTVIVSRSEGPPAALQLLDALQDESDRLLLSGGTPWEIDEALKDAGFRSGPYENQDRLGLDAAHARRKRAGDRSNIVGDRMVAEGRLGRHCGVGWYRYPGGGGAVVDPLLEDLVREEAHFAGIAPRTITPDEIVSSCLSNLERTANTLLSEGVIASESELTELTRLLFGLPLTGASFMHYISNFSRDRS